MSKIQKSSDRIQASPLSVHRAAVVAGDPTVTASRLSGFGGVSLIAYYLT